MNQARLILAAACLLAGPVLAQAEALGSFDTFSINGLDNTRWVEADLDATRTAVNGRAVLGKRSLGTNLSDAGGTFDLLPLSFINPELVTAIMADVTVDSVVTTACEANTMPAITKLRLGGAFFNAGTPTANSALGDVVAQVVWSRASNSTDGATQMRLTGSVQRCTNIDCSTYKPIGTAVDMGLVDLAKKTRINLRWDAVNKTFSFRRDAGVAQWVTYIDDDSTSASKPAKSFSIRNAAPNCASGDRGEATLKVRIDNVALNASALP